MFILILVIIAILTVVGLPYGIILSSRQEDVRGWTAELTSNRRSKNPGVEDLEVQMNDASLGELFVAFPEDGTAYYTPGGVSSQTNKVVDAEGGIIAQVRPRFPKVKTAKATRARRVKSTQRAGYVRVRTSRKPAVSALNCPVFERSHPHEGWLLPVYTSSGRTSGVVRLILWDGPKLAYVFVEKSLTIPSTHRRS